MDKKEYTNNYFSVNKAEHNNFGDYDALIRCLNKVKFRLKLDIETNKLKNVKIIMPYLIGCGLANGDISIVKSIIDLTFEEFDNVEVVAYKKYNFSKDPNPKENKK